MSEKIEPTQAMVLDPEFARALVAMNTLEALRAALNHPDARGLFADVDDRPWEPLSRYAQVRVGDEVRRDSGGITTTAVVARVDGSGDPWTAERACIGLRHYGTWYVRRAGQELPTEDGAVIVPADGHEFITMVGAGGWAFDRLTYSAEHDRWYGMTKRGAIAMCLAEQIIPGTWKVDGQ